MSLRSERRGGEKGRRGEGEKGRRGEGEKGRRGEGEKRMRRTATTASMLLLSAPTQRPETRIVYHALASMRAHVECFVCPFEREIRMVVSHGRTRVCRHDDGHVVAQYQPIIFEIHLNPLKK